MESRKLGERRIRNRACYSAKPDGPNDPVEVPNRGHWQVGTLVGAAAPGTADEVGSVGSNPVEPPTSNAADT